MRVMPQMQSRRYHYATTATLSLFVRSIDMQNFATNELECPHGKTLRPNVSFNRITTEKH